jgi:DNA-binding MarR family transcriptional regulator
MGLWESDGLTVNKIARKLLLNKNPVTLLFKRVETQCLLTRQRWEEDESQVFVTLTPQGKAIRDQTASILEKLVAA